MINIHDKEKVFEIINNFQKDAKPLFGKLTSQHVLEHLMMSLHISTGKRVIEFKGNEEMAQKIKANLIYTDAEVPEGVKNPLMTDELPELKFENIEIAKQHLKSELEYFFEYKKNNPNAKSVHMRMNELTMDEWSVMHGKHFTHHFKQYGLI
ncbi:MAG: hypothetical protein SFY56_13395 [Bacteroidota bacterium]|nr:hypothetical protein [Bacteroidota bacterium]